MDTVQILYTLCDVGSFLDVFPTDLLPHSITQTSTVNVNADPHTERLLHWLVVHSDPNFRVPTTSIHMATYPPSIYSLNVTERLGTLKGGSCKF